MIVWAANDTDFNPLAHTLLTVVQGTVFGRPAKIAACLAGACPIPALQTFPKNTSSTIEASIPALSTASFTTVAPSLGAGMEDKDPPNDAIGVLHAETITASFEETLENSARCVRLYNT
jgi:hypothetical protein